MALTLSRKHVAQMIKWAAESGEQECCGLLLGQGEKVSRLSQTANVSARPHHEFEIDPATLIAAHKASRNGGPAIIGYFHSHPNGLARPSSSDVAQACDDGRFWLIIADNAISAWRPYGKGGRVVAFDAVELVVEG